MADLAREIAEAIVKAISEMSAIKWVSWDSGKKWRMKSSQLEPFIAAKLAKANKARDERDMEVRKLLETAHSRMLDHWEAKGDVAKALVLLGGGDGD